MRRSELEPAHHGRKGGSRSYSLYLSCKEGDNMRGGGGEDGQRKDIISGEKDKEKLHGEKEEV